jgi:hypothetical protein
MTQLGDAAQGHSGHSQPAQIKKFPAAQSAKSFFPFHIFPSFSSQEHCQNMTPENPEKTKIKYQRSKLQTKISKD